MKKMQRWWKVLLIFGVLFAALFAIMTPWNSSALSSHPRPAKSYGEAMQRIERLKSRDSVGMNPLCQLQLMTHNKKVSRAIILVHGYTSCPRQFQALGQQFYDMGYNVLIAPLPHHGLKDKMTEEHGKLKTEELAAYADETVDIARGLGDRVTMMGISAGGVTTGWAAQNRSDLDLAVIISPAFGFKKIPNPFTAAVMIIYRLLPDAFEWWDPALKTNITPTHLYPRYSQHALVQILRLGFATEDAAEHQAPAAKRIVMIFNPSDSSINNERTTDIVKIWQAHHATLGSYEFPAQLQLAHDLIDPSQPKQKVALVYPRLIDLVNH